MAAGSTNARGAMNPVIPASPAEVGSWLRGFATHHAKGESPRIEVAVEATGAGDGSSFGLRLWLGARSAPADDRPPLRYAYAELVEGRCRLAWCQNLGARVRGLAQELAATQN